MSKKEKKRKKGKAAETIIQEGKRYVGGKSKATVITYFVLRFLVIATMVMQLLHGNYYNVFLCALTLLLFLLPAFVDKNLHIELPSLLEIIVLLFIFSAEILGEIQNFYGTFHSWDTMLHTLNGFMMAAIGFTLIDVLNNNPRFHFTLSPFFVAFVAFCFSMTIGVLWEFFEFSMDYFFQTDMQKDFIYESISTVHQSMNPSGANSAVIVDNVQSVITGTVDGKPVEFSYSGYLDIGIKDTMKDLFVNFIGALVYSIFGVLYMKGRSKFATKFMPRFRKKLEIEDITAKEND